MLLLHPLPTCADAGRGLCTFCPDLCTSRLWCYPSINQRKYSTCVVFSTLCKKDADLLMIVTNNINGTQPHAM